MELIMKSESVQIATCFCHGSIKLHYVVPICANKSFLFNIFISPCITFIQLLHLILLVKGKGKRSVQFYFIHLFTHFTTTIYLPILLQPFIYPFNYNNFACLFSMYRLTIYPFIMLQLYFSIAFNTYPVQQFNTSFTPICVFLLLVFRIRG